MRWITGGSQSRTVISKLPLWVTCPAPFVAVHSTKLVPTGKNEPEAGTHSMPNAPPLVDTVATGVEDRTTAPLWPGSLQTAILLVPVMPPVGGCGAEIT